MTINRAGQEWPESERVSADPVYRLFDERGRIRVSILADRMKYWTDKIYYGGFSEHEYCRAKGAMDTLIKLLETRELVH